MIQTDFLLGSDGVLPFETVYYPGRLNLFFLFDDILYYRFLLFLIGLFSVILIYGNWSRLSSIILYILVISLLHRAFPLSNTGFRVTALLLLFSALSPAESVWVGFRNLKDFTIEKKLLGFGPSLFLVQTFCMFEFSAYFKLFNESWINGEALHGALAMDVYSSQMGRKVLALPEYFLKFSNYLVLVSEIIVPLTIIFSFISDRLRFFGWIALTSLVLGISSSLILGIFPAALIAMLIAIFPSYGWKLILKFLRFPSESANSPKEILVTSIFSVLIVLLIAMSNLVSATNNVPTVFVTINNYLNYKISFYQKWAVYCQTRWVSPAISIAAVNKSNFQGDLWRWWTEGEVYDPIWMYPTSEFYVRNRYPSILWNDFLYYYSFEGPPHQRITLLAKRICKEYNRTNPDNPIINAKVLISWKLINGYHDLDYRKASEIVNFRCEN